MRYRFLYAAAAALLIPLMVSCEKNPAFSGTPVSFNISSISAPETKAEYSGVITDNKERVDWTSGDLIRIYSAKSNPTGADYRIGTVTASGAVSSAAISPDGSAEIEWSEGENVFYGVFPSPAVKTADVMGEGTVKGNIPSVQTPLSLNGSSPYVAKPDMTNCYMVARTVKTYTGGGDEVSLDFTPITTAIQFEIINDFSDDGVLKIKSISLVSEKRNISGTFTAALSGWSSGYPACTAPATDDGGKTVTVDFSGTALCSTGLAKGEKLTFTVFLRPASDADDLTFKITKPDDSWISTKLMAGGSYIDFPCHKKSYVTGLLVPDGARWTVKYDPDVQSWNTGNDEELALKPKNNDILPGKFSVSATKQVQFSRGNLQATYHSGTNSYTWDFAANQYDYIGAAAGNTTIDSQTDGAVVDLFGWSTETTYYGISTSTSHTDYEAKPIKDWGQNIGDGSTWRSLLLMECMYLFNTRPMTNGKARYTLNITYGGNMGMVIYPDDYAGEEVSGTVDELPEGVVFLPAAGRREGSDVLQVGVYGRYWMGSHYSTPQDAVSVNFAGGDFEIAYDEYRYNGFSVRLVTDY